MSKITLSVTVYAPCLNKTMIKSKKKQMISSADTFFWMTRYLHIIIQWLYEREGGMEEKEGEGGGREEEEGK